ncbi:UNVERIFIED_CONTAM: Protoporphyrinogen oxidase, chloroplastic [Sesamum calycinum]|uniref:Protoporphyrinogen oxidase n=1 Tax=Sesamum calycinum TaxID=2727403 RepID=A0AAW2SBS1_9LAMI
MFRCRGPPAVSSSSENDSRKSMLDCVIVGAGISGLCIAQALATKHANSNLMVTEARERVGGNITTVERDGYLWEEGPNSFQPSDPMLTMAVDSGLKDELVLGDPNAPRFVLWNGKLRPVPSKPMDLPFFDLMSFPGKLRAGFGAIGLRPPPPGHEESVEEFVRRNLGSEVFERLIEPFCSGVYAGDPSKLSMKAAFGKVWKLEKNGGSIIGGTFKAIQEKSSSPRAPRDPRLPKPKGQTVGSFKRGLVMLPNAISSSLGNKVKLSWRLTTITTLENGGYLLTYETPSGMVSLRSRSVVMTVPSYVASTILRPLSKGYCCILVLALFLEIGTAVNGVWAVASPFPGVETLGTIYSSSLFPNRAPAGRVLLLNYIGGATNPGITLKTKSQLVDSVDRDLRKMLINTNAPDPLVLGVRVWPQAIPQFMIGHLDVLDTAQNALSNGGFKGLFLGVTMCPV